VLSVKKGKGRKKKEKKKKKKNYLSSARKENGQLTTLRRGRENKGRTAEFGGPFGDENLVGVGWARTQEETVSGVSAHPQVSK